MLQEQTRVIFARKDATNRIKVRRPVLNAYRGNSNRYKDEQIVQTVLLEEHLRLKKEKVNVMCALKVVINQIKVQLRV
jgi:hypothetical protein